MSSERGKHSIVITKDLVRRFHKHVTKQDNGCWLWCASCRNGYGQIASGTGVVYQTHRLSWTIYNGAIPDNLFVLHNCPDGDNRKCCNPAHLFLGTKADNQRDKARKTLLIPGENVNTVHTVKKAYDDIVHPLTPAEINKFWTKIVKGTDEECWLWAGKSANYGSIDIIRSHRRVVCTSHRLSWMVHFGKIPDGMCVLHNCPEGDNRRCVNPKHLWLGSKKDNARDAVTKGNVRGQFRSKLHESMIVRIIELIDENTMTYQDIIDHLGIGELASPNTIRGIVSGRSWKSLRKSDQSNLSV